MTEFPTGLQAPLPGDELRNLSRNLKRLFAAESSPVGDVNGVQALLEAAILTANTVNLSEADRTATYDLLCGLIDRCRTSEQETYHAILWQKGAWLRLLQAFLDHPSNAKPKSMRQLLSALVAALQSDRNSAPASQVADEATKQLLELVVDRTRPRKVKSAIQSLTLLLSRNAIDGESFLNGVRSLPEVSRSRNAAGSDYVENFLALIFDLIPNNDLAPSAGQFASLFVSQLSNKTTPIGSVVENETIPMWAIPLERSFLSNPGAIYNFKNHCFPSLFALDSTDFLLFLRYIRLVDQLGPEWFPEGFDKKSLRSNAVSNDDDSANLLFSALQTGKELGLICETDYRDEKLVAFKDNNVLIPDLAIGKLLFHSSTHIRLSTLSLLTSSPSATKPLTAGGLQCLRRNFLSLFAETDANVRGEIFGLLQRLIDRLRAATAFIHKSLPGGVKERFPSDQIIDSSILSRASVLDPCLRQYHEHVAFIHGMIRTVADGLRPAASYQRHISSLRILGTMLQCGIDSVIPTKFLSKQAQRTVSWPFKIAVMDQTMSRMLHDLVLDPFDDVRSSAAWALKMSVNQTNPQPLTNESGRLSNMDHAEWPEPLGDLVCYLNRAELVMLESGRADKADGAARAYGLLTSSRLDVSEALSTRSGEQWSNSILGIAVHLVERLECSITTVRRDLKDAVMHLPMHGTLASLRYIIEESGIYVSIRKSCLARLSEWKSLHQRLLRLLHDIWGCVQKILCDDAPEGYEPDELEDDTTLTTKDVLSYCWRALKEASSLIKLIVQQAPYDKESNEMNVIEWTDFKSLGNLCFTELAELRHRGAFSTVAQTFAACCARSITLDNESVRMLPTTWYERTLAYIRGKSGLTTRRSAGIPSLLIGILSADFDGALLSRAIPDLLALAQGASELDKQQNITTQVHSLNCLKAIYTNGKLGPASERFIGRGLGLAASRMHHPTWAIRNCGLMLFRALIDRLLGNTELRDWDGVTESLSTQFSYDKFPEILPIVLELLTPQGRDTESGLSPNNAASLEGVFPALLILQRAQPPQEQLQQIEKAVFHLTSNPHWHVRNMAARTYCKLLQKDLYFQAFSEIAAHVDIRKQNNLHGRILCLGYLLKSEIQNVDQTKKEHDDPGSFELSEACSTFAQFCDVLLSMFEKILTQNPCPVTQVAYVDVINLYGRTLLRHEGLEATGFFQLSDMLLSYFERGPASPAHGVASSRYTPSLQEAVQAHELLSIILRGLQSFRSGTCTKDSLGNSLISLLWSAERTSTCSCSALYSQLSDIIENSGLMDASSLIEVGGAVFDHLAASKSHTSRPQGLSLLAELLEKPTLQKSSTPFPWSPTSLPEQASTEIRHSSPSRLESESRIWGSLLAFRGRMNDVSNTGEETQLHQFFQTLRFSMHEDLPFPTRYAAVRSLHNFTGMSPELFHSNQGHRTVLETSMLAYDVLNDDDDEIRAIGTDVARLILPAIQTKNPSSTLVPQIASQKLASFILRYFSESKELCIEATERVAGSKVQNHGPGKSITSKLEEALKKDNDLFAHEKQNLYIDEVKEAMIWSRILVKLENSAIPRRLAIKLTKRALPVTGHSAGRPIKTCSPWNISNLPFHYNSETLLVSMPWFRKTKQQQNGDGSPRRVAAKLTKANNKQTKELERADPQRESSDRILAWVRSVESNHPGEEPSDLGSGSEAEGPPVNNAPRTTSTTTSTSHNKRIAAAQRSKLSTKHQGKIYSYSDHYFALCNDGSITSLLFSSLLKHY
ncbi:hypothetical protein K402DRAFT_407216 [Aulographum hederae CBS 113979]|uniref:Uncharacterized protein n=1 Tax=Aulographum hederae CBS 113979 TaxID=1176131 RepID=A0A6G1GQK9_9PEZI|nr:hypothetical protein K402DRAFT_407216 [Aulographum hederae CBS 113979]